MSGDFDDYVVLFKSVSESEKDEDDVYYNKFRSANFQVIAVPVLDFEFINLDELLIKLKNPDDYEGVTGKQFRIKLDKKPGIIYTSPRCAIGVELVIKNKIESSIQEKWQKQKHFVVGEKTAQMVEKLKFVTYGKEAGNAKNLAEIISQGQYDKPFLYPKGSLTKDNFKSLLKENSVEVDDVLIYQTKCHPKLESNIEGIKFCFVKKRAFFIYFSPSGVNFTLPIFQKLKLDLSQIKFISIGSTTREALLRNGLTVAATSVKPEPQALLDAVLTVRKSQT